MEISIKSLTLLSAIVLTGLSAGLFYTWQVSVIPGTRKIDDMTYLQTMQSINRAILNPAFFVVFFGPILVLAISAFQQYNAGMIFWWLLGATVVYAIGTFAVTAFGNVPLNDTLEVLNLAELSETKITEFRKTYEVKWNRWHLIRTVFAVLSFVLALWAVVAPKVGGI